MLIYRSTWARAVLLILLVGIGQVAAQDTTVPPYGVRGSYSVGRTQIILEKGTPNVLVVSAWYPAVIPEGSAEGTVTDAEMDLADAPYPLVIFSHGFGDPQNRWPFIPEHLASWGFVVLAPSHLGDNQALMYPSYPRRLLEVKRLIQHAETLTAASGQLEGMIDTEAIAVVGVSAGGITAYGAGGAALNWPTIEQYCTEIPDDVACNNLPAQEEAFQTVIGEEISAEGSWPAIWDPRVKAIVPIAGTTELYGNEGLSEITIPVMVIMGSGDVFAVPQWVEPAYAHVSSTNKAQVVFEGANHYIFAGPIDDLGWNLDVAHDLINHFTTAFLLDVLEGDVDAHAALAPDTVNFPDITYQAEGY